MRSIILTFALLIFVSGAVADERLTGDDLKTFYHDKTLINVHFKKGKGRTYYGPDGKVVSIRGGDKTTGRWWINDAGDKRCLRWKGTDKGRCHFTVKKDEGTHALVRAKDGKELVQILKVLDGKKLKPK